MNTFVKMVAIIILVIIVLTGIFYIGGSIKSSKVANITIFIESNNESTNITNIEGNLERVPKISLPRGGNLVAPGIAVTIRQNMIPVSDWYSLPLNGTGAYNLKIGLDESFSENKQIAVYVQVVNNRSEKMESAQKELLLKPR